MVGALKNTTTVLPAFRKRRIKGTGRGDWESPPLYVLPARHPEQRGEGRFTSPQTLVLGCINVRGCSTIESKRCEIGSMFVKRKMDVLALCETKMKGKGEAEFGEVTGRISGVERGRAREGVALLLSERMVKKVVSWKEVSSRLMWVRVRIGRECWAFVSAYGPGSEKTKEEREGFWNELTECVDSLGKSSCVVVLGDLNARVGDEEIEGVVGKYGVPERNGSGESLLNMCVENDLVVGNSFFKKRMINKYTWARVERGRVIERALMDYVLITRRMIGRLKDVHVYRGMTAGMSDHFLVEGKMVVAKVWGKKLGGSRKEVVRVEELCKREKELEYQERVQEMYNTVKEREVGAVEGEWGLFKDSVMGCASDVCGKRIVGGGIRKGSEWWNEGVKMKVEEKKRAYEEWLQCDSFESYERYKEKKAEVKREVKEAKRAADFRWSQSFGSDYERDRKKFWKEVKRVRRGGSRNEETVKDGNGRSVKGNEARKRWAEYFESLLNVEDDREADVLAIGGVELQVFGDENEREITKDEVERALRETKVGKAAGMDGVRAEMLKKGGVTVLEWLVRLFNVCFMLSLVPVDWVCACIVPLFKGKGDVCECCNYRGISLLSVVGKVYGRVLINRIRDKTEMVISEVQGGFRRGRGCTDQVFVVRQICEKYLAKGKDVYFAFMDLEKAYDRVDRDAMWNVLRLYGVDGKLLDAVKSLYVDSKACVRVGNGMSEWFPVRVGLRQGCVMSPWLFNLFIDGVVREVNACVLGRGLGLVDERDCMWELNQLLFADDTVFVADSEEKLCRLVAEFGRVCERRKLRVNVGKSKVMRCTRGEEGARMNVILNGEVLEEVDRFKYLGSVVAANGGIEADVCHRVNEGCKMLGALKGVMKCRGLGMNVKKVLYEKVIVPTVTYGSECWGMKVSERQKLNVFEMRCLRSMAGVSRMDRVRNEVVRQRTGVEIELGTRVDMNVLRWFGHVERMENERLLKRVMNARVNGRGARGRPRLGWMDGVKRALQDRGMDVREARERARDRNDWRAIVRQF